MTSVAKFIEAGRFIMPIEVSAVYTDINRSELAAMRAALMSLDSRWVLTLNHQVTTPQRFTHRLATEPSNLISHNPVIEESADNFFENLNFRAMQFAIDLEKVVIKELDTKTPEMGTSLNYHCCTVTIEVDSSTSYPGKMIDRHVLLSEVLATGDFTGSDFTVADLKYNDTAIVTFRYGTGKAHMKFLLRHVNSGGDLTNNTTEIKFSGDKEIKFMVRHNGSKSWSRTVQTVSDNLRTFLSLENFGTEGTYEGFTYVKDPVRIFMTAIITYINNSTDDSIVAHLTDYQDTLSIKVYENSTLLDIKLVHSKYIQPFTERIISHLKQLK